MYSIKSLIDCIRRLITPTEVSVLLYNTENSGLVRRKLTRHHFIAIKKPPFKLEEQGWGEFDMTIALHIMDKGGEHTVVHDLNFLEETYDVLHKLVSIRVHIYYAHQLLKFYFSPSRPLGLPLPKSWLNQDLFQNL